MTKLTKFSLTVLSALVLSACGGGGGGGSSPAPQQPKPQPEMKQPEMKQPEMKQPEMKQPEMKQPDTKQPDTKQPDTKQPDTKQPDTKQPDTKQPEMKQPEMKQPEMNQPDTKQPDTKQPDMDMKPNDPKSEAPRAETDQDVFNRFNPHGNVIGENVGLTKLVLDGKEIKLSPAATHVNIYDQKISTLRDNSGKLIGYFGYAKANIDKKDTADPEAKQAQLYLLNEIDRNLQATELNKLNILGVLLYQGKMYYNYQNIPQQVHSASVTATFHSDTKRFGLQIQNNDLGTLTLRDPTNHNLYTVPISQDSRNNVAGTLYENKVLALTKKEIPIPKATFSGGIFGPQGEILIGESSSLEERGEKAWKGVLGAKVTQNKSNIK